jgi:hypothetical protein
MAGWPQHFETPHQLTSGGDAWNAAFDFDNQGNYVATWYERTAGTTQYVTKSASLASDLTSVSGVACYACTPSDVGIYTNGGLGEYQDIWYTSSVSSWIIGTVETHSNEGDLATYNIVP